MFFGLGFRIMRDRKLRPSLTVTGGYGAAGIGANWVNDNSAGGGKTVGTITIEGGTIKAYGKSGGAGWNCGY